MSAQNIYYVYAYLREDLTPYYIGKGCKYRINAPQRTVPLPPKERRVKLVENLTEDEAYKLEAEYIAKYGRKDIGTGILRNMNEGGKGSKGTKGKIPWNKGKKEDPAITAKRAASLKGIKRSEEYKAKMSAIKKGTNAGSDNPFFGKTHSAETRARISKGIKEHWENGTYD